MEALRSNSAGDKPEKKPETAFLTQSYPYIIYWTGACGGGQNPAYAAQFRRCGKSII
jgi:hypothetical protein